MPQEQGQNIDELVELLATHYDTQTHELLMMYYWNIFYGEDVYDVDIDAILSLFDTTTFVSIGGAGVNYGGGLVVKTDELNTAPVLTKDEMEMALRSWLSGDKLSNALSILDKVMECQDKWNVNGVFIYAIAMNESSMGTDMKGATWIKNNNWYGYGDKNKHYSSPSECTETVANQIANLNHYFTEGRYTVYEIGENYCTDPPPPAWGNAVTMHMMSIYNAAGKNVINSGPIPGGSNSNIVNTAQSKLGAPYVWAAHGPNSFDCSGFVEWCYRQNGINVPWATDGYKSYAGTANEISWDQAKPRRYFNNI